MRTLIRVAMVLAGIALPATAQERGAPPQGEAAPARGQQAERDKPDRAATPPGRGNPANRDAVVGDMKEGEVRHRERLAMIGRLRALATEKGQTERLAALDKLEAKENQRFERHLQKQRERMSDEDFKQVNERLAKGRGHGKGRSADAAKPERAQGQKLDRPGDDRAQGQGRDKDKADKERPEKEKADKDQADKDKAEKEKAEKERAKPKEKERAKEAKAERAGGGQGRAGASGGDRGQAGGRSAGKAGGGKPRLERA